MPSREFGTGRCRECGRVGRSQFDADGQGGLTCSNWTTCERRKAAAEKRLDAAIRKAKRAAGLDPDEAHPVLDYHEYIPPELVPAFWLRITNIAFEQLLAEKLGDPTPDGSGSDS